MSLRILGLILLLNTVIECSEFEYQPKIQTNDGALILEAVRDKNITFRLTTRDSTFLVDELNVLDVLRLKFPSAAAQVGNAGSENEVPTVDALIDQMRSLKSDLQRVNVRFSSLQNRTRSTIQSRNIRRYLGRIRRLFNRITEIENNLSLNECVSSPTAPSGGGGSTGSAICKNGGTCYDSYKDFHCDCPMGWEGKTCEDDVDECYLLAGTALGCQNGGTCVNMRGSYSCTCRSGFSGTHCRIRNATCDTSQSKELCGNGICIQSNNEKGYTCICDQGWTTDKINRACTVDVNECNLPTNPCHSECINLPGSFKCGSCPRGYTGDGVACYDVNECAINNGGCSVLPKVTCINAEGSYHCGNCPSGWMGDGRNCEKSPSNSCDSEHICHPKAKCEYVSEAAVCTCPNGMYGHGFGPNGCTLQETIDPCVNHQCKNNAICTITGRGTRCICSAGYTGPTCEQTDACHQNPCRNGGTCSLLPNNNNKNFRCSCPRGTTGDNCEILREICGSVIRQGTGELSYPSDGTSYAANERCAWIIRSLDNTILNVTFSQFDLEDTVECNKDWLQIHDGRSLAAQMIGRFCGKTLPRNGNIISSQQQLFFWFRSDNATNGRGFKMSWFSQEYVCGEILDLDENDFGVIRSPGYPGKTASNRDCEWRLNAPFGYRVVFRFYDVSLGGHKNCTRDTIKIFDSDLMLKSICETSRPEPLHTSSNKALIHFHTDSTPADSSFQLHYEVLPAAPHCGGIYTEPTGIITGYMNSEVCLYLIQQPVGTKIKLEFTNIELLKSPDCSLQNIEIYNGKSDEDPLIQRLCYEQDITEPILSKGNFMLLRYEYLLRGIKLSKKFEARYSRVCEESFFGPDGGIFTTPNYPNAYFEYMTCTFNIYGPEASIIHVNFTDFSISESTTMLAIDEDTPGLANKSALSDEFYNYVDVYLSNANKRRYYKGAPMYLVSEKNRMRIVFHANANSQKRRGIRVEYYFEDVECGGVLTRPQYSFSKSLISINPMYCEWIIEAPEGKHINLNLTYRRVGGSDNCFGGAVGVSIYANDSIAGDQLLDTFCNEEHHINEPFHTNVLTIISKMGSRSQTGFALYDIMGNYSIVDKCGGNLSSRFGVIKSPGWPKRYQPSMDCTWIISAPLGHKIELIVRNFSLETTSDNCLDDTLEIRNGKYKESPLIGKYCGTKIPTRIPSFANQLYLHFTSDDFLSDDGFYISWQQTETGCGGKLSSHKGSIHSPHNWDTSAGIISCDWQIAVSEGSKIDLSIMKFQEMSDLCASNAFAVYDGPTTDSQQLKLNCSSVDFGLLGPFKLRASTNQVLVRYSWEESGQDGLGFLIDYETNCNVQIDNLKGVIESPNFPDNYPPGMNCAWDLRGGRNNKFSLAFSHLEIENRDSICDFDYVEVIDMRNDVVLSTHHLCSLPAEPLISEGNRLLVKFVSDYSTHANGFRAEYKRLGCGEHLTNDRGGSFGSPNAPYSIDLDCDWYIEVPAGKQIFLHLTEVHIESDKSDCSSDGIIIMEDKNSSVTLLKECQIVQMPITVTAPANRLYVHFFTSGAHSRKYFKATYAIRNAQCGGVFRGNAGLITSPDYPNRFATNMKCIWYITVEDSYGISFEFEHFNLTAKASCADTNLELYRMEIMEQHLLQRVCGETKPNVKHTTGNQLIVSFKVGIDGWGKFAMRYQKQCGGNSLQPSGFVKSVNNENCEWVISSSEGSQVTLDIFSLECQCRNATNCTSGLWLFNANDDSELGHFCTKHPANIVVPAHNLRIKATNVHFRAKYSTVESSCGGTLTSLAGFLTTPHYPNAYPANIECIWEIEASHGNGIELNFDDLNIATSDHCNADFLEIRGTSERGPILGLYCSSEMPMDAVVVYEKVWIKFRSVDGDGVGGNGFKLSWNFARANELNDTGGTIEAPPVYAINDNDPYSWRIMVQRGKLIVLNFKEYNKGLNLYDGFDENAIKIDIIYSPWRFVSSSNVLYLATINDELDNFKIVWSTTNTTTDAEPIEQKDKCYKELIISYMDDTNISSPGYPLGYAKNLKCEWLVKPKDPAEHIVFSLYEAKLENSGSCSVDFLSVLKSSNLEDWHQELKICDSEDMSGTPINVIHGIPYVKLEFNSDVSINGSGFTSLARSACGSNMTGPIGQILGYKILRSRAVDSSCLWHIKVKPGKRILFNFEFDANDLVPKSEECRQYAVIYDGLDDYAPILQPGRICNQENHNTKRIESTANHVTLKYSFNFTDTLYSEPKRLWNVTYREFSECDGEIRLTEYASAVNISSPRYPNVPNPHTECSWVIIAPAGDTIEAEFLGRFDMNIRYCSQEYVELIDGSTVNAPSLGRYCTKPSNALKSTGNVLSLRYLTDITEPRNGFIATLRISKCGRTFTNFADVITSQNYPALGAYPRNTICEYIIKMSLHSRIRLNFTNIDLPFNETKLQSSDRLEIILMGANPGDGEVLYGNLTESVLELDTNEVMIRFVTKQGGMKYRGFQLKYLRSFGNCFRDVTGASGVLNFNNLQSTSIYSSCRWKITVPKGQRVSFEFLKIEGETLANNTQRFLTILSRRPMQTVAKTFTFFNDHELVSKITDFNYENFNSSAIIRSTDNYMYVRINLERDTFTMRKGRARFSSDEEAPCPPDIGVSSNGIITLNALRSYASFYCQMKFQLSGVETITFKINELQTIRNESLARPYAVRIRDEQIFTSFRVLYGNVSNELISLSPKRGSVSILQNDIVKIAKFSANYRRNPCGGLLRLDDGIAISFPDNSLNYNSHLECVWTLRGGYTGNPYMLRGNVSLRDTCEREYLVIYAGNTADFPELARICRDSQTFNDTLLQKQFTMILYHAEVYKPYESNFNLKAEKTVVCGSKINVKWPIDPIIMSAKSYKNNMECSWEFETAAGFFISLYFTGRFFIEDSENCTNDHLEVQSYDAGQWVPKARFCGREVPDMFNITSNRIQVVFRTNEAITGDGFTFTAVNNCVASFNVTNQMQTIRTPTIDNTRYSVMHCEYKFNSESEALINVRILDKSYRPFRSSLSRYSCDLTSFVVYKRDIFGAMVESGKYCEDAEVSSRKYLQLNYDAMLDRNFEIEYGLNACGGNVSVSPSVIRSLQSEDREFYVENMNCVWNIVAPPDHSIIVRFKYFDMEHNFECGYDHVSIYAGPLINDEKRLARLCGNLTTQPPIIMVDNNQAVIAAVSDSSNAAKGFLASVTFTPNCNEHIGLSDGNSPITLTRSFHLNTSAENYLCHYRVTAPEGYRVNVQLNNLQLNTIDCRSDECKNCNHMEILNSIGVKRASIGRYCKNGRSDVKVISAYEDILLILNLERVGQYIFEIVLQMEQSVCGGRNEIKLKDNELTNIVFPPNSEAHYQPNTHCMWRIKSDNEFQIQFNYLLLQNVSQVSGKCLDYVHIRGHYMEKYFCGNATGYRVHLTKLQDAFAEISFHSDETMEGKGFSFTAMPERLCNHTYNGMSDLLEYKNYEGGAQQCIDEIRVAENYTLSLFIPHLSFDYGNCSTKFLKIVDLNSNKTILDRCENYYIEKSLFTQTNALRLHVAGFVNIRIFYTSNSKFLPPGCGGKIYATEGQISNPPYIDDRNPSECRWELVVPAPNKIRISFYSFNMGSKTNCALDYMHIMEIQSNGSEKLVKNLCGEDVPESFLTESNIAIISKKSPNFDGTGWTIAFELDNDWNYNRPEYIYNNYGSDAS